MTQDDDHFYTIQGDDGYTRISQTTENLPKPSDIGAEYTTAHPHRESAKREVTNTNE